MSWVQFILSAGVIVFSGIRLTIYADKLSDRLHLGKMWVGILLLGFVTSLPEAITSIFSVVFLHAGDLAVGNMLGSNNFNPMLIVVMDAVYRKGSITNDIKLSREHVSAALLAAFLTLIAVAEIVNPLSLHKYFNRGCVSILVVYFVGMKYLSTFYGGHSVENSKEEHPNSESLEPLNKIYANLVLGSLGVVGGAIFLAKSADVIALNTGLGRTFVGSVLLAIVTSLPEMVVSLSALRLGSFDLAVGNIFGSNMTNVLIISITSFFYSRGGLLFNDVSSTHVFTGMLSVVLTGLVIAGIYFKNKKTFLKLGWDSLLMMLLFSGGMGVLYIFR